MVVMATGHREPQGGDTVLAKQNVKKWLSKNKNNIDYCISGAAIGFDTAVSEICLELEIPFWLYEPYKRHGQNWDEANRKRHEVLKKNASGIIYVCELFDRRCFLKRDERMVQDSDYCIAYLSASPKSHGTAYTVKKAKEKGIPVENFWQGL